MIYIIKNIHWFGGDCFSNMFIRNIKTMNFKYDREYQKTKYYQ